MPKLQFLCNRLVAGQVGLMEIVQQTAALSYHLEQAAARTMVLDVLLQMLGQMVDPLGQERHLHIRGPGVLFVKLKARYRLSFFHISIRSIQSILL